ncbi:MAG: hypothetical protein HY762_01770 [Planctomycetes bacterium]|nr:hypothetical protein [Planctomycetota bacterium]
MKRPKQSQIYEIASLPTVARNDRGGISQEVLIIGLGLLVDKDETNPGIPDAANQLAGVEVSRTLDYESAAFTGNPDSYIKITNNSGQDITDCVFWLDGNFKAALADVECYDRAAKVHRKYDKNSIAKGETVEFCITSPDNNKNVMIFDNGSRPLVAFGPFIPSTFAIWSAGGKGEWRFSSD